MMVMLVLVLCRTFFYMVAGLISANATNAVYKTSNEGAAEARGSVGKRMLGIVWGETKWCQRGRRLRLRGVDHMTRAAVWPS